MFDLIDFFKNKLWVVLITLGALCLVSAAFEVVSLADWKVNPREQIAVIPLAVGAVLFLFGIVLMLVSNSLFASVNIEGRWEYSVYNAEGGFSHKGECYVRQKGQQVWIHGTRLFTCAGSDGSQSVCRRVNIPWGSDWASICNDETMRFDYHIDIPGDKIEAICRIKLPNKKPVRMSGNYYLLPPFEPSTLNCRYGEIKMKKIDETIEITPPNNTVIQNRQQA